MRCWTTRSGSKGSTRLCRRTRHTDDARQGGGVVRAGADKFTKQLAEHKAPREARDRPAGAHAALQSHSKKIANMYEVRSVARASCRSDGDAAEREAAQHEHRRKEEKAVGAKAGKKASRTQCTGGREGGQEGCAGGGTMAVKVARRPAKPQAGRTREQEGKVTVAKGSGAECALEKIMADLAKSSML